LNTRLKFESAQPSFVAQFSVGANKRENDPVERELDAARRRIGELVMEVEILQKERRAKHPLVGRRSSR